MALHKIQHYLPQHYLKGFSIIETSPVGEKQEVIWVYDFKKQTLKQRQPKSVAWKPYYYSVIDKKGELNHKLECELSRIENDIHKLFEKIDEDVEIIIQNENPKLKKMMPNDKNLLITFLFLMLKRVPASLDKIYEGITNFAIEMEQKYKSYNLKISENLIKNSAIEIFHNLGLSKECNIPKRFLTKNIQIAYIHNDKSSFITTDNPVSTWRRDGPAGIVYDDTEIYFPINKRCFLVLYGSGDKISIAKYSNRKQIYGLNKYISRFAQELLISRSKELLLKLIKDLKLSLKS